MGLGCGSKYLENQQLQHMDALVDELLKSSSAWAFIGPDPLINPVPHHFFLCNVFRGFCCRPLS